MKTIKRTEIDKTISELTGIWNHCYYIDENGYATKKLVSTPLAFDTDPATSWRLLVKWSIKARICFQQDAHDINIVDAYDNISGEWLGHGVGKTFGEALSDAYLNAHGISVED